jgi:cell division protein FtsA
MMDLFFQRLRNIRNFLLRRHEENGHYPGLDRDGGDVSGHDDGARQLFTALDVGTAYAKAMIVEVHGEYAEVLGVGHHQQNYNHMSDGIVTDIPGVIANCNQALLEAERAAGGVIAPSAVIGIAGELVKGSSTSVSKQRSHPKTPITVEELDALITSAQKKLLQSAQDRISAETGYRNIEVRLTNAAVISVRIDGQTVSNPIGFPGRYFGLTLFSAFAPLMQLGALEAVAQGLDLTLQAIVTEPYALARCLSVNAGADSGAIFIDVGGGTTDIALVRQGGIEETRMFALGGRTFTRRIATSKGISLKDAERLKISYSNGEIKGKSYDEIHAILAPECQTWMDSVELLIEELAKGELLPPAIYVVGGGSKLSDLYEKLQSFPWTERLPFSRQPIVRIVLPEMVANIADPAGYLSSAQDITPMALAFQAVELQNEYNVLERAINRVIDTMHI